VKVLTIKNYGSIPHLPGSRLGPSEKTIHEGQARIATKKARRGDIIIVTEKLDGSNVGIYRAGDTLYPVTRAGYTAKSSPHIMHHIFDEWVWMHQDKFMSLLVNGERIVGEWMIQAHGTMYDLDEPFFAFDIMFGHERILWDELVERLAEHDIPHPHEISYGEPISIKDVKKKLGTRGFHNAVDPPEGAVWRVEHEGKFDFMCKYVRPDKVDGKYLDREIEVWNWRLK